MLNWRLKLRGTLQERHMIILIWSGYCLNLSYLFKWPPNFDQFRIIKVDSLKISNPDNVGINIRHHYNKIEGLKHLWRNYGVIIWDLWPLKTQYLEIFQNIYEEIVINISSHEHFLPETSFPLIRACHFLSFKRKSMFHFSRFQIFIRLFWSLG